VPTRISWLIPLLPNLKKFPNLSPSFLIPVFLSER